jgi:hypothetical protein
MSKIVINTGFGYFKDSSGNIVCKYELPPGEHPLTAGFTFHEVENKAALEAVQIYRDPADIEAALVEAKIRAKTRELAITSLKAAGELPANFEDTI